MLNKAFYIILFLSLSCCVQAQKIMRNTSLLNYQRGDRTVLHFGFSLGINYMDYKAVLSGANGWRAESGKLDVGFLVGIVSELRLGDDWGLRFCRDWNSLPVRWCIRRCRRLKITNNMLIMSRFMSLCR